jgi:hypothetical protein
MRSLGTRRLSVSHSCTTAIGPLVACENFARRRNSARVTSTSVWILARSFVRSAASHSARQPPSSSVRRHVMCKLRRGWYSSVRVSQSPGHTGIHSPTRQSGTAMPSCGDENWPAVTSMIHCGARPSGASHRGVTSNTRCPYQRPASGTGMFGEMPTNRRRSSTRSTSTYTLSGSALNPSIRKISAANRVAL